MAVEDMIREAVTEEAAAVEESAAAVEEAAAPVAGEAEAAVEEAVAEEAAVEAAAEAAEEVEEAAEAAEAKIEEAAEAEETAGEAAEAEEAVASEEPGESMGDLGENLEKSYKLMGDGVHDTDTLIAWERLGELFEEKADIEVEVSGIVNKGVIVVVEGIRGFVPASRLSLQRVDDLNDWLGRMIKVRIITCDPEKDKLVLSAREILREERDDAKKQRIEAVKLGEVFDGKVDSIQDYGVFVDLGDGLSGLVHISQISLKRIKHPSEELKVGDEVRVKVIGKQNGKLKLSIKALAEQKKREEEERVVIPKAESIGTSLGDLLQGIRIDEE